MQHTQLTLRRRAVVISRDRPTTTSCPHRTASCPFLLAAQWSNVCHDHTLCHLISSLQANHSQRTTHRNDRDSQAFMLTMRQQVPTAQSCVMAQALMTKFRGCVLT